MSSNLTRIAEEAARGGLFLLVGNAVSTLVLAIGSIVVARLLGPDAYGLYGLSLVVPSVFLLFTDFGVDAAVTRFSAKLRSEGEPQLAAGMLRLGFLFKLLTAMVMLALSLALSETLAAALLNRPEMGSLVRLAAVLIPFQAIVSTATAAFLGLDRMEDAAMTLNAQSILKAGSSPLLVILGFGVVGALLGHILGYAAAAVLGLLILFLRHYRNLGGAPGENALGSDLKVMMSYGLPLYASALLGSLLGQYQTVVLAHFTSNAEIGNLGVAMQFAALIGALSSPMAALFPAFSKLNPGGPEAKRLFTLSVRYTSLFILPAAVAIAILSKDLILSIYGASFSIAPLLLSTYALNFLCAGIGSLVIGNLLSGAGESRLILKANLVNLAIFLPLAPALTGLSGALGVVLAGLVSGLCSIIYQLHAAKGRFGIDLSPAGSLRIYVASALSAMPTLLFLRLSPFQSPANVILGGSLFLISFLTASPLLGAVRVHDIENLRAVLGRLRAGRLLDPILAYEVRLASSSESRRSAPLLLNS